MAEAIVSLAIQRISDLLIQEAVFMNEVSKEVESLMSELKRMRCFLKDVDRKQEQDDRLRNRVSEIRDLAYDAEDVIDSFILRVAHQGGFQGIIKRFTSILTKPFHLHKIGVQIKSIQTKLETISKSLPAYEIPGEGEGPSSTSRTQQQLRRTYSHVEEVDVVGLEGITRDVLAQLLREDEDRPHVVVSIVGMGGIGKTTLARKVYNHIDVKRHFDCLAWTFLSEKCMLREVLHDVLVKVHPPCKEGRDLIDKLKENELVKRIFVVLKEKRYLVVLDDIWKSEDWNRLKPAFPHGKKGSKILFTTRNKEIALFADPCKSPIELPLLTDDESWKLFSMKAFLRNNIDSRTSLEEFEMLGREMVKKCGGLPLAIVALGGLLATKRSHDQWEMVQKNIHAELNNVQQEDHHYGVVNGILALSYNDLPYYLKPCFLYLGHYSKELEISKKGIIRLWIAEGFISPSILEREGILMEDVAEQFLEELINRCVIQVSERGGARSSTKAFRMHDLLRDLCVKKAREENFLGVMDPSVEENDMTLTAILPRRIAIHSGERYVNLKGEHPNLRTLFLKSEKFIECKKFKFLRVLKFERKNVNKWNVSSEIGNLLHLRYLYLIYRGEIILPRSIGKLKSLQTLHARCYGLKIAPEVLFKLECLRHILLPDVRDLIYRRELPCFRPRFTSKNIETLKYTSVENLDEMNAVLSLKNIRSLGIMFKRSKDVETFLKAVIQFHRLQTLDMRLLDSSVQSYPDLEPLSHCHHISKLFLEGKIEEGPHLGHCHVLKFVPANIVELALAKSALKQDAMAELEKLPHLRILRLWDDSYFGIKLSCSANGFLQLDFLEIWNFSELEEWEIEEGSMPRLRYLRLSAIPKLKMFSQGLRYLTTLQEMELNAMKRSLVERIQVIGGREGDE